MNDDELTITHSKGNMASYAFGTLVNEFMAMAFSAFTFFYYEAEIGLSSWLVGIGYVIFAIWNAVNDPIVGYICDRPFFFTRKWGRRFPWILIGGFGYVLSYILIFTPPALNPRENPFALFLWLVFTICLYDTFASIYWVNYSALFPDKFRTVEERRTATGFNIFIGVFGSAFGAIIPPLIIVFGDLKSYLLQAWIVTMIGVIGVSLAIAGCREDKQLVEEYLSTHEQLKRESFFKELGIALKQRTFVVFVFLLFCYQVMIRSMTASIPYAVRFILKMEASAVTIIMAGFLISVLIFTPAWVKFAHKLNDNRKVALITGGILTALTTPFIFINEYVQFIIVMVLWGIPLGGFWAMQMPILGDVIDESVVKTGKRKEGIYNGFQQFFSRLAIVAQALSFSIVHVMTGFVEGSPTQTPLAEWGIHVHLAVVPMVAMIIGLLIFYRFYDLTPEKIRINQLKILKIEE